MKIQKTLEELLQYYQTTRAVGHTYAMINGAKNTDNVLVLVHSQKYASEIKAKYPKAEFTGFLNLEGLRGKRKPLLIDNGAMCAILQNALIEIRELQKQNKDLKFQLTEIKESA